MTGGMCAPGMEWLLLLAFPNGGSTAMAKLLLTAPGAIALNGGAEGQWLVPEMSAPRVRWDPNSDFDYEAIRERWLAAAELAAGPLTRIPLVIEKSPPNMCRYQRIIGMLDGMKTDLVVMTRDPFATCASWHARYGPEGVEQDWGWPGDRPTNEAEYFAGSGDLA